MKNSGTSFLTLLGLSFIILKLCKVINWSWRYVTMPLWGGIVLALIIAPIYIYFRLKEDARKERQQNYLNSLKPKSKFQERLEAMQKLREQK